MFEEYQKRALPGLLKERLQRRLQSDPETETEEIRRTKEHIERIIASIIPEVMNELSQQWHQPPERQASGLPMLNSHRASYLSFSQAQQHQDMTHFYAAPPSVPESSTLSLSDLNPLGQQLPSSKPATDSGYFSANTLMYGQVPEHSVYCPSPGQSFGASQPHHFAPPGRSAFSDKPSASSDTNQLDSEFMQLDFDLPRSLTMEPATILRETHSSLSAVEQPDLGSVGNQNHWSLGRSQAGFDPSFQAVADGTQDTEPFSDLLNFDPDSLELSCRPRLGQGN
jgi:hypothetical protein